MITASFFCSDACHSSINYFVRVSFLLSQDMRDSIEVGLKRANGISQHAISAGGSKRRKVFGIDGFAQSAQSSASDNSASLHHAAQVGSLVRQWYCPLSIRVFPMVAHWTGLVSCICFISRLRTLFFEYPLAGPPCKEDGI